MPFETDSKILHDKLKVFVEKHLQMRPRGMSSDLNPWYDSLHLILSTPAEAITFDQLCSLNTLHEELVRLLSTRGVTGLPGSTENDYKNLDLGDAINNCRKTHSDNQAFTKLQNFYLGHLKHVCEAADELRSLGRHGGGHNLSNPIVDKLDAFTEAVKLLDPNHARREDGDPFVPDVMLCRQVLSDPKSPLRNSGISDARSVIGGLRRFLGEPVPARDQQVVPSYASLIFNLENANEAWVSIKEEINNQKAARTRA